jgi:hypothetical protein
MSELSKALGELLGDDERGEQIAEELLYYAANSDRLRDELLTVLIVQDTLASDD